MQIETKCRRRNLLTIFVYSKISTKKWLNSKEINFDRFYGPVVSFAHCFLGIEKNHDPAMKNLS